MDNNVQAAVSLVGDCNLVIEQVDIKINQLSC